MSLYYKKPDLPKVISLNDLYSLLEIDIMYYRNYRKSKTTVMNGLPVLVTSFKGNGLITGHKLILESQYIVNFTLRYSYREKINLNKRITILDLAANDIQRTNNSLFSFKNAKTKARTLFPNSLLLIEISYNPLFKCIVTNRVIELIAHGCTALIEPKARESIIRLDRRINSYRRPRNSQKSIRYYILRFPSRVTYFDFIDVNIGLGGVYNNYQFLSFSPWMK